MSTYDNRTSPFLGTRIVARMTTDQRRAFKRRLTEKLASIRESAPVEVRKRRVPMLALLRSRVEVLSYADGASVLSGVAPRPCPNQDCHGGFVSGEDPHACGDC